MEFYLILGLVLFIFGVASTFVYDHFKKEIAEHGGFFKAKSSKPTTATKKYVKYDEVSANAEFLSKYEDFMKRAKVATKQRNADPQQVKSLQDVMAKLEKLKRDI